MIRHLYTHLLPVTISITLVGCANFSPVFSLPEAPVAATVGIQSNGVNAPVVNVELKAWQDFFPNPNTRELISLALENNRDLRIAAANVAEAEGLFQIQRKDLIPSISLDGTASSTKNSINLSDTNSITRNYGVSVGLASYEIDFWGRVRNLNDAALASYFSTLEAQRSSRLTVISSTANAYSNWLAAKEKLHLAEQTLDSRKESYELIKLRQSIGIASSLDLAQAEVAALTVEAQMAQSRRTLTSAKATLELLVGAPIGEILTSLEHGPRTPFDFDVPDNLSSQVILSRPDIIVAEQALRAANANIGAARAAFLPRISLSSSAGISSDSLNNLFEADSRTWSFIPSISFPIFGNANNANLDVAKARRDKHIAEYEKAIQTAFSEIYINATARMDLINEIDANERLVKAQEKRLNLAEARYEAGLSDYIEVLDAKENLFTAQQSLLESQRSEAESVIELYRALGGGDDIIEPTANITNKDHDTENITE